MTGEKHREDSHTEPTSPLGGISKYRFIRAVNCMETVLTSLSVLRKTRKLVDGYFENTKAKGADC